MTLVRNKALEWLQEESEKKDAIIESLTQDLIEMTLERDAAVAQVRQIQSLQGERD